MAKITEAQANEALRAILADGGDSETLAPAPAEEETPAPEPEAAAAPEEPAPAEAAPEAETPVEAVAESDDVASLKQRLADKEAETVRLKEESEKRFQAMSERYNQNERIRHERFLRKASVADRALQTLKRTRVGDGVPEAEVDQVIREIESTMNPASPSYAPPAPPTSVEEDRAVVLNSFLNEKMMTQDESNAFGAWMQTEAGSKMTPSELNIANRDLDAFLRLAHNRWETGVRAEAQGKQQVQTDAVRAVQSVQRVQRAAAKAASTVPAAPRKTQPAQAKPLEFRKMSKEDQREMVSKLVRESVEQYR